MGIKHLNDKTLENVTKRLWIVSGSLRGVGGTLTQGFSDFCMDADEAFGLGQYLKSTSEEISRLEDILNCGHDSRAENEFEEEDDCSDDDDSEEDDPGEETKD